MRIFSKMRMAFQHSSLIPLFSLFDNYRTIILIAFTIGCFYPLFALGLFLAHWFNENVSGWLSTPVAALPVLIFIFIIASYVDHEDDKRYGR